MQCTARDLRPALFANPTFARQTSSDPLHVTTVCESLLRAQVLLEFKEYATEVDVDFVRKSVRAIGRCAVSIERAAER